MKISLNALAAIVPGVIDVDHNGVLSEDDRFQSTTADDASPSDTVTAADLRSEAALAKLLEGASHRAVNVVASGADVYIVYSSTDHQALEGVAVAASGEDFNLPRLAALQQAPDYAQGYPASARRAVLAACQTRSEPKRVRECVARTESAYQNELLPLAQDYDVALTMFEDAASALNALFLSGALSADALASFVAQARATEAARSAYETYDL